MSEEEVEMNTAIENIEMVHESEPELVGEDDEMLATGASTSTADSLVVPLQQQLAHIDQHYPPPIRPTHPASFHSVGKKRKRLNESVAVAPAAVSPASLYRDVLHSIFQFLNLKEFVRTCVISKTYYSAGRQMRTRKDTLKYRRPIFFLGQSPLRHHISKLDLCSQDLDPNGLLLLQTIMGHLDELSCIVKLTKENAEKYSSSPLDLSFAFPKHLKSLSIEFHFWKGCNLTHDLEVCNYLSGCLKQIAAQSTCLLKLEVYLTSVDGLMACPQALQTIKTLTDLTLPFEFNFDQQIDLIKALPSLRIWWPMEVLKPQSIQRLADGPPGPPQFLEYLGPLPEVVNDAMAEQLIRLTTLTTLHISSMTVIDPTKFLPHFPRLSILTLYCEDSVNANHLAAALSACVSLTDLTLQHTELTSPDVGRFLSHLRSLIKLELFTCVSLVSLEFLTTARAVGSLVHLAHFTIRNTDQMPIIQYHHLRAISPSLESLTIYYSSNGRFDPLTISRWTPDSIVFSRQEWPRLKSFYLCQYD